MVQALIALSGVLFAALLGALVALYNKKRDIKFEEKANDLVKDEWVDRLTQVAENPTLTRTDLLAIRRSLRLFPYDKERVKVDLYESVYKFSRLTNEKELESIKDIESNLYHFVVALFIEIIKEMDDYYSKFSLPIVIEEKKARVVRLIARWELSNRWIAVKEDDGTSNSYKKRISLDLDVLDNLCDEELDTYKKNVLEENLIKAVNIEIKDEELRADQKRELKTEFDKSWSTLEKGKNDEAFTGKNPLHSDSYQVAQRIGYILYSAICAVGSFFVIVVIEGSIADQLIDWLKGIGPIINLALIGLSIMILAYLFKIIITLPEKISKKSLIEICVVSSLFLFLGSVVKYPDNKEMSSYFKVDTVSTLCLFFSAILLSSAIFVFTSQPFGRKLKSLLARTKEKFFK